MRHYLPARYWDNVNHSGDAVTCQGTRYIYHNGSLACTCGQHYVTGDATKRTPLGEVWQPYEIANNGDDSESYDGDVFWLVDSSGGKHERFVNDISQRGTVWFDADLGWRRSVIDAHGWDHERVSAFNLDPFQECQLANWNHRRICYSK